MKDWTPAHTEVLLTVVEASTTSAHSIGGGLRLASFLLPERMDEEPTSSILSALAERGLIKSWGVLTIDPTTPLLTYVAILDPARHVYALASSYGPDYVSDEARRPCPDAGPGV